MNLGDQATSFLAEEQIYDPAMGLQETDPVPIEHWDFSASEKTWSIWLYYLWGLNLTWMTILGGLIWSWYPGMIVNNWWWRTQCPPSAYTSDTITATTGVKKEEGTSVLTPVDVNGWTQYNCLRAAPVKQWTW